MTLEEYTATLKVRAYAVFAKNRKNTKQNTARSAALKWKIMEMTMMNKYIQQFLDDNDLQAGE